MAGRWNFHKEVRAVFPCSEQFADDGTADGKGGLGESNHDTYRVAATVSNPSRFASQEEVPWLSISPIIKTDHEKDSRVTEISNAVWRASTPFHRRWPVHSKFLLILAPAFLPIRNLYRLRTPKGGSSNIGPRKFRSIFTGYILNVKDMQWKEVLSKGWNWKESFCGRMKSSVLNEGILIMKFDWYWIFMSFFHASIKRYFIMKLGNDGVLLWLSGENIKWFAYRMLY